MLPRYLHFMAASLAMTGLFLAGWFGRKNADLSHLDGFTGPELRRLFYKVCAYVTLAQFALGPLLLFTLPSAGITTQLYVIIVAGALVGLITLLVLFGELKRDDSRIGSRYWLVVALFSFVVLGMGTGRHVYRQAALAPHQAEIKERTLRYAAALAEFNKNLAAAPPAAEQTAEQLFTNCAACHAPNVKLVGPPLTEIAQIYAGNPAGIVAWAKAPGKKRSELPPMPPMGHLGEPNLRKIAELMLEKGRAAK